jgi:phosphoglycolate phosphatase-like HAD superfamily hydrolase
MPELLADLGGSHDVAVVTSNSETLVRDFLDAHGVQGVSRVAGAETSLSKVEKVRDLIARLSGSGDVLVRERHRGRHAGGPAGRRDPLGVAWGWHDRERLSAAGAVASSPATPDRRARDSSARPRPGPPD